MSRLRPVHQLTKPEADLQQAVLRPPVEPDSCSLEGAKKLKEKIEAYWTARGHNVDLELVDVGFHAAMRSGRTDLRSDMINGMPRIHEETRDEQ